MDFNPRKRYAHEPRGWSLIAWKQYADLGLLGVPFAEEHHGARRRSGRDHDRGGADRARAVARALSRHGRTLRRIPSAWRLGRAARRTVAQNRRGRTQPFLRPCRTAGALRSRERRHHGAPRRRRLRARRRQDAGAAWQLGGKIRRLGARFRGADRPQWLGAVFDRRNGSRRIGARLSDGRWLTRRRSDAEQCARRGRRRARRARRRLR